jgi:hypothetical protein
MQHLLFGLILVFVAACQPVTVGPDAGSGTPTTSRQTVDRAPVPKTVTPVHIEPAPPAAPPATPSATPDRATPPAALEQASPETVAPAPTAPTLVAVAPPPFDPAFVMRRSPDELAQQLGPAAVVRTEGPAHIWQYQLATCVADFFFYPKAGQTDQLQVMAWHARSPVIGQPLDMAACRAALTQLHHAIRAG